MNDPVALAQIARLAREEGAEEVVIGLTYSISEVHDDEHYAKRAAAVARLPDVDRLYLKDPGGLLTVDRIRELAPLFVGRSPGALSSSTATARSGSRRSSTSRACRLGFGTLHTAVAPLAQRHVAAGRRDDAAQPRGRRLLARARPGGARASRRSTSARSPRERGLPLGEPAEYDAGYYHHQLPGGVVTTMRRQLGEMRRPELFDESIEEIGRVRADIGLPDRGHPVCAVPRHPGGDERDGAPPSAERYTVSGRDRPLLPRPLRRAARAARAGGRRPRPLAAARGELGRVEPLGLEGARERFGSRISDEELLLRLTMPAEQVDAMWRRRRCGSAPAAAAADPLVTLLREIERRRSITHLSLSKGDDSSWRSCGLRTSAGSSSTWTGRSSSVRPAGTR